VTAPDGWTPDQIAAASIDEIAAGRLPLQAQWRIAEQREQRERGEPGSFTSSLSVDEFAAIRSVGFTPVGQVLGSAVYNVGWWYDGCGYGGPRFGGMGGGFSGYGGWGPAPVVPVRATAELLTRARHAAVDRLRAECEGLGGDGVVGVRLLVESFYGNGLEFMAVGTAVRADSAVRPRRPFTSDLSGQDFAKLLRGGWVPVGLAMGVGAVVRHDDWALAMQQTSWSNQEVAGSTELVAAARHQARDALLADARAQGGQTVVLRDSSLGIAEVQCRSWSGRENEARDHIADAFLFGTAIVPFTSSGRAPTLESALPMLRLDRR
jgi:uncharacterized protein YbjQ (UPF0145 family)